MKLRDRIEYFYNKSPIPLASTSLIFKSQLNNIPLVYGFFYIYILNLHS